MLHIQCKAISVTDRGCPLGRKFPVNYELLLHIKSKAIPEISRERQYVISVRYKYHLCIKIKAIPITGRGGTLGCETLTIPRWLGNWLANGDEIISLTL
jgi:hypothetical protein